MLAFCFAGIFGSYMWYGFQQKALYEFTDGDGHRWNATPFQLLCQCVANLMVSFVVSVVLRFVGGPGSGRMNVAPLVERDAATGKLKCGRALSYFFPIGCSYALAMLCSNVALRYVSYSAQALAKSCKIIPVMVMRIVINKKRYSALQYCCAISMTLGIVVYNFYQKSGSVNAGDGHNNTASGLALLFFSLACDGVTGPMQESVRNDFTVAAPKRRAARQSKQRPAPTAPSSVELMFKTNLVGIVVFLGAVVLTDDYSTATTFFAHEPKARMAVLQLALTSALGQNFIFLTLASFDSLMLTTMTTTRKFFTFFLSTPLTDLTREQISGSALVFGGVALDLFTRYTASKKASSASGGFNKTHAGRTPFPGKTRAKSALGRSAVAWDGAQPKFGGTPSPARRSTRLAAKSTRKSTRKGRAAAGSVSWRSDDEGYAM